MRAKLSTANHIAEHGFRQAMTELKLPPPIPEAYIMSATSNCGSTTKRERPLRPRGLLQKAVVLLTLLIAGLAQKAIAAQVTPIQNDVTKGVSISFHVTSVSQEDSTDCDPNDCSGKRFTIHGYIDKVKTSSRVLYVLSCDEVIALRPDPHPAMACAGVHANRDYDAKMFSNSISFWPEEKYTPPPYRALYNIVSETEVSKTNK